MAYINSSLKSLSTLIAGIINSFVVGTSLSWIAITHHLIAFHAQKTYDISNINTVIICICIIFAFSNLFNMFSSGISSWFNTRTILVYGYLLIISSHFILYYTSQFSLFAISFALYGGGLGLIYQPSLRNQINHFPSYRGCISVINIIALSTSSPLLYSLSSLIKDNKKFLWICLLTYTICGVVAVALTFDYIFENENIDSKSFSLISSSEKEISIKNLQNSRSNMISRINSNVDSGRNSYTSLSSMNTINTNLNNLIVGDNMTMEEQMKTKYHENVLNAMKSGTSILIFIYQITSIVFGFTYAIKITFEENDTEQESMYYTVNSSHICFFILGVSGSRIILPILIDFMNIKFVICIVNALQIAMVFTYEKIMLYPSLNIIPAGCYVVNSIAASILIGKIFGEDYAPVISSIVNGSASLSALIAFGIFYCQKENGLYISATLSGISLLLSTLFIKIQLYDYSQNKSKFGEELKNKNFPIDDKNNIANRTFDNNSENDVKSDR